MTMNFYGELALSFMKTLISADTTNLPGNEQPLAETVAEILSGYGFRTQVQKVAENRANMIAVMGSSPKKLILNGHLDVVPAGEGWKHEPFAVTEEDGKYYGRGACDMKGALACMMAAAVKTAQEKRIGDQELVLAFVADEEIDGIGTKAFVRTFEKGERNWVVIGEATGNQLHIAHRGVIRFRITLKGRQCHAGQPDMGINANTLMAKLLLKVDELHHEKQKRVQAVLPPPSVTATRVSGGFKDNVVPGSCEVVLDYRTVPGDTVESLRNEMENILHGLFDGQEDVGWDIVPFICVEPGMIEPEHEWVKTAARACKAVEGRDPEITYFGACCDMSCFCSAGFDTLICGPGSLAQAHTVDEFVDAAQFAQAVDVYAAMIEEAGKA